VHSGELCYRIIMRQHTGEFDAICEAEFSNQGPGPILFRSLNELSCENQFAAKVGPYLLERSDQQRYVFDSSKLAAGADDTAIVLGELPGSVKSWRGVSDYRAAACNVHLSRDTFEIGSIDGGNPGRLFQCVEQKRSKIRVDEQDRAVGPANARDNWSRVRLVTACGRQTRQNSGKEEPMKQIELSFGMQLADVVPDSENILQPRTSVNAMNRYALLECYRGFFGGTARN